MKSLGAAAVLLAMFVSSASAQTAGPVNSSQMDAASSANDQQSPGDPAPGKQATDETGIERIRQDLQRAGFTDVRIVARSFVVQARSSDGNPVVMTIGPHGMSVFEAMTGSSQSTGTVGMGNGSDPARGPMPDASGNAAPRP